MAKQLISALEDQFNPKDFKDEYRERVLEFIKRKAKGRKPKLRVVKPKRKTGTLDNLLARSLKTIKKGKRAA